MKENIEKYLVTLSSAQKVTRDWGDISVNITLAMLVQ